MLGTKGSLLLHHNNTMAEKSLFVFVWKLHKIYFDHLTHF